MTSCPPLPELVAALRREVARLPADAALAPNVWQVAVPAGSLPDDTARSWEPALADAALDALTERGLFAAGPVSARIVADPALASGEHAVRATVDRSAAERREDVSVRLVPVRGDDVRWGAAATIGQEQALPLAAGSTTVGRASTCDLVLDHPSVRDRHVRLELDPSDGRLQVVALDPHGWVHVDGRPVRAAVLTDGSRLTLGELDLVVRNPAARTGDEAGDAPVGHGPFARGWRRTPLVLWVATALMLAGLVGVGVAVVLGLDHALLAATTGGAGVLAATVGVVLAVRHRIFEDVT